MQNIIIVISEPFIYHLIDQGFKNLGHKTTNIVIFYCYFFIFNHLLFTFITENNIAAVAMALFATFIYSFIFIICIFYPKVAINYLTYHIVCITAIILWYNFIIIKSYNS